METQPFLCRAVQTLHYRQHSCFSLSPFHGSFKQEGKAFPPWKAEQFLPQTFPAQIKPLCCGDGDHSPAGPLGGMHCTPSWTGWGTFREHSALSDDTSSLKDYQLAALILGICKYQKARGISFPWTKMVWLCLMCPCPVGFRTARSPRDNSRGSAGPQGWLKNKP